MELKYTRLYSDGDSSHFEDCCFEMASNGPRKRLPLPDPLEMILGEWEAGHLYPWHNAEVKQWVVTLSGEVEVELSDGSKRRFKAGDVVLAEVCGRGATHTAPRGAVDRDARVGARDGDRLRRWLRSERIHA